jgi:hypothetical protein
MQNYRIIRIPAPQLKSKPMFMNKVVVQAAPVEGDDVLGLVVAEELVAALLQPLPIRLDLYYCFWSNNDHEGHYEVSTQRMGKTHSCPEVPDVSS